MGSQKRLVQRVERKLEQTVGDAFARIFGGSIVPQEVEALLRREAADGIQSLQGNRLLAPNEYIITLGVHDFEKLGADPELKSTGFARDLADYIQEQGWQTYGDVVVRFEQSSNLHTGQFRARGTVNPDVETHPPVIDCARPQSNHAFGAEPGVAPMSDNSSYRGGQGQGRPDEYYDDRYARPQEDPRGGPDPQGGSDPRGGYPPETGGYPPQPGYPRPRHPDQATTPSKSGTPTRAYPEQRGYPDQRGYQDQGRGYPDQGQGGYPPPTSNALLFLPARLPATALPATTRAIAKAAATALHPVAASPATAGTGSTGVARLATRRAAMCPLALRARPSNDRLTPTKAVTTRATSKAPRHTAGKTMAAALTTPATPNPRGSRDTLLRVAGTPNPPAETTTTANQALRTTVSQRPVATAVTGRAAMGPPERRLRCSSTTAADALTSSARAPTSSVADRTPSSGCPTPVCHAVTWRSGGTGRSHCSQT
ncbi:conserved hypothetical protein [Mycobacterium tuberculosis T46]|nr:conserved hypothetical protein [Mycobacterium tuberculosis T46]